MVLNLKCKVICTDIKKKSQSPAFRDLQIGDKMLFSVSMNKSGSGRSGGTHAKYINCYNYKTKEVSQLSFNQIGNVMKNFEFEEIG